MIQYDEYRLKTAALLPEIEDLKVSMGIPAAEEELTQLESETADDGFWNDLENSQKVLIRIKRLKNKIASFNSILSAQEDLLTLIFLANEENDESFLHEIEKSFSDLLEILEQKKLETLLSGEYDNNNAIISFHAGAGGTEAQDWAQMLYRMYSRWAERRGFKYKTLDYQDGDEAGIKSAAILVEGDNVFGYLKSEAGVHRLVRVSPFDASGRRHTSFAAVEVTPDIEDDTSITILPEDLRVDTYRSSGAGGQHVNKTESAIRLTHLPTGIVVACQNERSQVQNREVAMRMLRSKLVELKIKQHLDKIEDIKGEQKLIEWGSQIRSYVFMPYTLVKDNRSGYENGNISAVMDGDLDGFINAYLSGAANGTLNLK